MKYYLVVGEASGDLHASNLMKALHACDPRAEFRFFGGDKMQAAGGTLVRHYRDLAYMGFVPVLLHLPAILRSMALCKRDIRAWQPDALVLVDYPGFNLSVAQHIHAHTDIPVFYYIAPKIWAWKERRIRNIRRDVDHLFSILPFEVGFFEKKHHYPVHYVGNPCVDAVCDFLAARPQAGGSQAADARPAIAILPGSRTQEIKDNLPAMLRAAARFPGHRPVVAAAPSIAPGFYRRHTPDGCGAEITYGRTYEVLHQAAAALVTSGTATLEAALLGVPQVVCYHVAGGKLTDILRRHLLKVPYISLVNLVAGREVVRELVGGAMRADNVAAELAAILPGGAKRAALLDGYGTMREALGPAGASRRAAEQMAGILRAGRGRRER